MTSADLHWIANYIWGIADDVLRDLYVRGKYRDVILPMTVLRRLDAVLEDTKQAVHGQPWLPAVDERAVVRAGLRACRYAVAGGVVPEVRRAESQGSSRQTRRIT